MRVLFSFAGGSGHFLPTLPIARAIAARGHSTAYSCQEAMVGVVEATGFAAFATGGQTLAEPAARLALLPVDRTREEEVIRTVFVGSVARERAARLLPVASRWRPDVIVRDEVDVAAAVIAERLGLPHAAVIVLAAGGLLRPELVAAPLAALRAEHGLPADPGTAMLHRYLTLAPVPPSFRDPRDPLPSTARHLRPAVLDPDPVTTCPDWLAVPGEQPGVYVTLGTVFPQESGDLFTRVLAGVRELAVDVVVTVGSQLDPAELGDQPPQVRVERFVPQAAVLARCDVLVCHGGAGSVVGALAHGVPSVLLPMGADQPLNADRCAALGVSLVLDAVTATADEIRRAVAEVLANPSYRAAARSLQYEVAGLPGADHAATLIEDLAASKRPRR